MGKDILIKFYIENALCYARIFYENLGIWSVGGTSFKLQPKDLITVQFLEGMTRQNENLLLGLSNDVLFIFESLVFTELQLIFQFCILNY